MYEWGEWEKVKKENQFFIPNFQLTFQEFLDIFAVFHSRERVFSFMKKLLKDGLKFAKEYEKITPSPIQVLEKNEHVLGIDYGFFLNVLVEFIVEEGGIIDENEREKADKLLRGFFGYTTLNLKYNYSSHVLMKELFGRIYNITNYKNLDLKGRVFYDYFTESSEGDMYLLHLFFIKKISLYKIFLDEKIADEYINEVKKVSSKLVTKMPYNTGKVKELFKVDKKLEMM